MKQEQRAYITFVSLWQFLTSYRRLGKFGLICHLDEWKILQLLYNRLPEVTVEAYDDFTGSRAAIALAVQETLLKQAH